MATISNAQSSLIDSGENFMSPENPLIYSSGNLNGNVNVSVLVPFHDNVYPDQTPVCSVDTSSGENNVSITPQYNATSPLSSIYTQVVKISFTLNGVVLNDDRSATINVTVDEEGLPESGVNLGEPKRTTKILVPPQN